MTAPPDIPPGVMAALDQRIARIGSALDSLVEQARGLSDDPAVATAYLSLAIGAVLAELGEPETVADTLALAVRRLAAL